jgi:GNAT superfamily N-acetyltransferase
MNPANVQGWLALLLPQEVEYNEEVHHLGPASRRRIEALPPDGWKEGSGWLLTFADTAAGEWNLAHAVGDPTCYVAELPHFPAGEEFHLLIPRHDWPEVKARVPALSDEETLIWHVDPWDPSSPSATVAINDSEPVFLPELPPGFEIRSHFFSNPPDGPKTPEIPFPHVYVLENGSVVSLVKPFHQTATTIEVYIETLPGVRNRGLGTRALMYMRTLARTHRRRLVYVASATNHPSLHVARKIGLTPVKEVLRVPFQAPEGLAER